MNITQRIKLPRTYQDVSGLNVGDEKVFPDGSKRVLGYSNTGGRRWFAIGKDQQQKDFKSPNEKEPVKPIVGYEEKMPEKIDIKEWLEYNRYLTEKNPFLSCQTYDELVDQWFTQITQLQEQINIGVINKNKILRKMDYTDNCFLAILMYKLSVIIYQIRQIQPYFNYKKFLKGKKWNDIYGYYESLKDKQITDYTKLYNNEDNSA